jgi:hypothetical protein
MELAGQIHAGTFKVGVQIKVGLHTHLLPDASTYPVPFPTTVAPVQATQSLVTLSI